MKKVRILGIIGGTLLSMAPFSLEWSQQKVGLMLDSAQARIGRPLTPVSVAGANRRAYRRAAVYGGVGYGSYYGSGYPNSSYYTTQSYSSYYSPQSYGGYYGGPVAAPTVRGVARRTSRRTVRRNY
jgi:hypothetical protein